MVNLLCKIMVRYSSSWERLIVQAIFLLYYVIDTSMLA
jgi:hypothetical protein